MLLLPAFDLVCSHTQDMKQVNHLIIGDFPQKNEQISSLLQSVLRRKGDVNGHEGLFFRRCFSGLLVSVNAKYHNIILMS